MEATTRLMKAEGGSLLLVDEEKGQLHFEVVLVTRKRILRRFPSTLEKGSLDGLPNTENR